MICDYQFTLGEPAALFQKSHPDWIPKKNMGHSNIKPCNLERYDRLVNRSGNTLSMEVEVDSSSMDVDVDNSVVEDFSSGSISTQTDLTQEYISNLEEENSNLKEEVSCLKTSLAYCLPLTEEELKKDEEKLRFYTGLPNFFYTNDSFQFDLTIYHSYTQKRNFSISRICPHPCAPTTQPVLPRSRVSLWGIKANCFTHL